MKSGIVRQFGLRGGAFSFELCKKTLSLGQLLIDHCWMPVTSLYGQRRKNAAKSQNHSEILRLYWAVVQLDNATADREAQERYLLASLVPHVRVQGSRTIFADAFLRSGRRAERQAQVESLESALRADAEGSLSREEFFARSWDALGRPDLRENLSDLYKNMTVELFDAACALLADGELAKASDTVQQIWDGWMQSIGRHRGNEDKKLVLDVLSYESRAAFHECYSVAWSVLIPLLECEEQWSEGACSFHRFWHTDWKDSQTGTSLFHGHIFGLHPATAVFMQTKTGPELLGDWLAIPESVEPFGRVLNGLLIALFDYRQRRELAAEERPRHRLLETDDLEAVENREHEHRRR